MPLKRFLQTPPADPTRDYDVANKKYIDDLKAAVQADSTATGITGMVTDFNALIAKLKASGIMKSS